MNAQNRALPNVISSDLIRGVRDFGCRYLRDSNSPVHSMPLLTSTINQPHYRMSYAKEAYKGMWRSYHNYAKESFEKRYIRRRSIQILLIFTAVYITALLEVFTEKLKVKVSENRSRANWVDLERLSLIIVLLGKVPVKELRTYIHSTILISVLNREICLACVCRIGARVLQTLPTFKPLQEVSSNGLRRLLN